MEGFGEKSCQNLLDGIEKARQTSLSRVIYSLGIANIGLANAKLLCKKLNYDLDRMMDAKQEELSAIDGIGDVIAGAYVDYMSDPENREKLLRLMRELKVEKPAENQQAQTLEGLSFVVTGSLVHYASRNDLKDEIEARGGKVTGSVTGKTECLINNDLTSNSTKNQKAKELGVKILSEEEFLAKYFGAAT